jgi:hypothetical protein
MDLFEAYILIWTSSRRTSGPDLDLFEAYILDVRPSAGQATSAPQGPQKRAGSLYCPASKPERVAFADAVREGVERAKERDKERLCVCVCVWAGAGRTSGCASSCRAGNVSTTNPLGGAQGFGFCPCQQAQARGLRRRRQRDKGTHTHTHTHTHTQREREGVKERERESGHTSGCASSCRAGNVSPTKSAEARRASVSAVASRPDRVASADAVSSKSSRPHVNPQCCR